MKNVLAQYEITAEIRNDRLFSLAGSIPIGESLVELWVEALDFRRATDLVKATLDPVSLEKINIWVCDNCSEEVEEHFAACWSCGAISN
jgi:hypothetical protein